MDTGSLANLSLAEIASMLNAKQQEVLLASISVAARFIQQLQAEEQLQQAADEQAVKLQDSSSLLQHLSNLSQQSVNQHTNNNANNLSNNANSNPLNHLNLSNNNTHNNSNSNSIHRRNQNNIIHHQQTPDDDQLDDDQFQDDEDEDNFDDDDDDDMNSRMDSLPSFDDEHNSTADRQTLLTIKEFADELKARRKSIRLSQKGAAQSLRAFTGGEQPCTDAIIYHFENLQLEPDRAMQLIPLLTNWLDWAEKHRMDGKQLPMMSAVTKVPRERKRKVVLFNEKAKQYLEDAFVKNNHPDRYQLDVISQELNIPTRSIRKWFTNRRQRKRFAEKFSY